MISFLAVILAILAVFAKSALTSKGSKVGSYQLSKIGCGTWSWGNRFLWGYSKEDDDKIQQTYEYITKRGVNWLIRLTAMVQVP